MIDSTIFRAYDIRGIVDKELTEEAVRLIGQAVGSEVQDQGEKTVVIGCDGRLSKDRLLAALREGLLASGCDVIDIGMVPTPLLYFSTKILNANSGVMLTGSHNPPEYNGLKVIINDFPVAMEGIQTLYQRIVKNNLRKGEGKLFHENVLTRYMDRILFDVKLAKSLNIVIDCGNGVTGMLAEQFYKKLGCQVKILFGEVDGNFPNHQPDPSEVKNLKDLVEAVKKEKADIGIAFDGDGDRLGIVTNEGKIIWPDRTLMLFAVDVLSRNPGAEIIYDVKCTAHLKTVIEKNGGKPLMWRTGHSFIKEKMKESGDLLAGEMSGHFFFKERWYGFDDALYSGARLLEILSKSDKTIHQLFAELPDSINTPELRLPISEEEKFKFMDQFVADAVFKTGKITTIDGLRVDFDDGFGLIRPSNTTPYLILRFEGTTKEALQKIQDLFRKELLRLNPKLQLPF